MTPAGLAEDRTFMVVDAGGTFVSQRAKAEMALVRPTIEGAKLRLSRPGAGDVVIDVQIDGKRFPVKVWNHQGDAVDQGDEAGAFFSDLLGGPYRLVRVPPGHARVGSGKARSPIAFSDSTAVTVASESSLDDLNARLGQSGAPPIPMNRFRPNVVVRGWTEPFTEDRARRMSVGGAHLEFAKLDIRCRVTTIDQDTGQLAGPEPLKTLATYRRDTEDGGVAFAMKAAVTEPGAVKVGDPVTVSAWQRGLNGAR